MVSLNHGHLYLLLGRRLRVGGDDHVYPEMASSPGKRVEGGGGGGGVKPSQTEAGPKSFKKD